jgi:hypothetical protein
MVARRLDVTRLTNVKDVRQYMANVERKIGKESDEWRAAFRHLVQLEGGNVSRETDPERRAAENDFYSGLAAYEELLAMKHGRRQRAGYTRRMLNHKTVFQIVEDWVKVEGATEGFKLLIAMGMPELTGEHFAIKWRKFFGPDVVERARRVLAANGVNTG